MAHETQTDTPRAGGGSVGRARDAQGETRSAPAPRPPLRPQRGVFEKPRGSGVWWINYYDADGQRHREKIGGYNRALDAYLERKMQIRDGKFRPPRVVGISFRELAESRMAAKEPYLSPRSLKSDRLRLKIILEQLGERPAAKITPDEIDRLLAKVRAPRQLHHRDDLHSACGATANRYRSLISSVFSFGIRARKLTANPCAQVQRFKESAERVRFLDAPEEQAIRKIIRAKFPENEPEFDLALNTGMRRGEQFDLTWDKIDLERGILEARGKTGRRFIPINATAREALLRLHRASNGSRYVCAAKQRDGQDDWRRWFEECVAAAGIEDFRWHDLRHTFASRLVMAGVDLRTVQKLLGHATIVTTMKYAHVSDKHAASAVEKLDHRHSDGTSASAPKARAAEAK